MLTLAFYAIILYTIICLFSYISLNAVSFSHKQRKLQSNQMFELEGTDSKLDSIKMLFNLTVLDLNRLTSDLEAQRSCL